MINQILFHPTYRGGQLLIEKVDRLIAYISPTTFYEVFRTWRNTAADFKLQDEPNTLEEYSLRILKESNKIAKIALLKKKNRPRDREIQISSYLIDLNSEIKRFEETLNTKSVNRMKIYELLNYLHSEKVFQMNQLDSLKRLADLCYAKMDMNSIDALQRRLLNLNDSYGSTRATIKMSNRHDELEARIKDTFLDIEATLLMESKG